MSGIDFTVGLLIVSVVFLAASEMRGGPETRRAQRRVIVSFQDILEQRLERHQPRAIVWLDNDDERLRPHALLEAYGFFYYVRSSADEDVMQDRADEVAAYFDRKQLMGQIPND